MAASSSSPPALSAAQHSTPEFRNWLALGHALTTVLCQGLRPFINREIENFYRNVTARLAAVAPCACVRVPRRKPNEYHDMSTCAWANTLQGHHQKNKPNWKQSDSTKWLDPHEGPWEITKLFLSDLGGHAVITSAEDMDITGILNLMFWCDHFTIPQPLIEDVRDTRNNKWAHVPKLELSDAEKTTAFGATENLLKDPHLAHDPDAQNALREIQTLKCVSDLNNFQAQVLTQYKEMIEKDISNLKSEVTSLKAGNSYARFVKNGALFVCSYLIKRTRAIKRLLTPWLMFLLLCSCFTILDPRSYKDGKQK